MIALLPCGLSSAAVGEANSVHPGLRLRAADCVTNTALQLQLA